MPTPEVPKTSKEELEDINNKEQAVYNKIASMLNIPVDKVEDLLFDVITEGSFSDIVVNNDGTITLKGKTYNLKSLISEESSDTEDEVDEE